MEKVKPTLAVAFLAGILACSSAWAEVDEKVIETLVYEAVGEGINGMTAVAEVIRNRAKDSCLAVGEDCYEAVVMAPDQFSCWNSIEKLRTITPEEYQRAAQAWELSRSSNLTKGAKYYHTINIKKVPSWASRVGWTVNIGNHRFYV